MNTSFKKEMPQSFTLNAENMSIGRLASKISYLLRRKNSIYYSKNLDPNVTIFINNISKISISNNKFNKGIVTTHSGYIGGIKIKKFKDFHDRHKLMSILIKKAILGMLPKSFIFKKTIIKRVKILN